jgi:hypothetical protein
MLWLHARYSACRFALSLVALAAGCRASSTEPGGVGAAASATASGASELATPAAECAPGARRCERTDEQATCTDGRWTKQTCEAGELCAGAACTMPLDAAKRAVADARLRTGGAGGFLNAWSVHVGVPSAAAKSAIDTGEIDALGAATSARALCGSDGWLRASREASGAAVANGLLWSAMPHRFALRASVSGKLAVRVGERVHRFEELPGDGALLLDEHEAVIELGAGVTPFTVAVEPASARFALRLVEVDGRPAKGVVFTERFESAACRSADLVDAKAELVFSGSTLALRAAPRLRGLVPRGGWDTELSVEVRGPKHSPPALRRTLRPSELLATEPVAIELPIELAERGETRVVASLGGRVVLEQRSTAPAKLRERIDALVRASRELAAPSSLPVGAHASFEHHTATLADAVVRGERDLGWLEAHTKRAEALLDGLRAGVDAYASQKGIAYRAYRSPLDGRLVPYVAFVPRVIERGKPLPVVFVAHGKNRLPEHALRTLVGEPPDDKMTLSYAAHHLPHMPEQGALLVAPWGYGDAGVQPVAEHDLLRVLDELRASYPVDESRVSLTGYSMGGTLSFVAPLHHPDRFAAAAPLCGYPNLLDYRSVSSVDKRPWERALLEKEYIVRYADNGLHLPLHVIHGGLDVPGRSKVVVDRYRELGQSVIFDVPKEAEHDVWTDGYENGRMVHWLTRRRRPEAPEHVRLVSGEYRYDRAYWVRIVSFDDASRPEPAHVEARWKPAESELALELEGVRVLELDLTRLEPAATGPVTITIAETKLSATPGARVYLVKEAGSYTVSEREPSLEGHKRHGQSGPLDDVQFTPVTIVVGTQDPTLTDAYRLVAEHLRSLGGTAELRYPVVDDTSVNDAELDGRSVILLGTPEQNLLTRAIASALPARFERGALTIAGARHEGEELATSFIAPRPLGFEGERTKQRHATGYVVVHAASSARAALAIRMLPRFLPDWVVYDASLARQKGGLLFDQRPVRAGGFFSERWE